jgi:energy-converting hydrogenase Eha subunit A
VGALALTIGVTVEAAASKMMVWTSVKALLKKNPTHPKEKPLTYSYITKFYYPLALTSIIGLGVHPMVTFFLGQSRMALESLAVLPVVNSFIFLFRSLGLSFQEVGIALLGENNENFKILKTFTIQLIIIITAVLFAVAFSPLSYIWYNKVSGLSIQLTKFSLLPTKILILLPGLTVLLSFLRSITAIDVAGIFSVLFITTKLLGMVGVIGAAIAIGTGRLLANAYISIPCYKILNKKKQPEGSL